MFGPSLGRRLVGGSAIFTLIALVVALFVMHQVLLRFVTGQIDQRLDNKIVALASQIVVAPDGIIALAGDADGPPFDKRRHRSFWLVRGPHNALQTAWLRSSEIKLPSEVDLASLPAPPRPPSASPKDDEPDRREKPRTLAAFDRDGVPLHMRVARREIGGVTLTIFVAAPDAAISGPMGEAMTTVALAMTGLGVALLLASLAQVRLGLRPLTRLREQVEAVRSGAAPDIPLHQPSEILPLVLELNALLVQNAETLAGARRHVANLAHGLKTPLATLALTLDRLPTQERGRMQHLVATIERRIRHHLGRARVAALDGPARMQTRLADHLGDLVETLGKIHAEKRVLVDLACPAELSVACEPQDVDEILGNLLENAFKYTRTRVACRASASGRTVTILIEDDGPGVSLEDVERAMRPGERLDEAQGGFGFGLPIARELAELYGGELSLATGHVGLVVSLTLPRAGVTVAVKA